MKDIIEKVRSAHPLIHCITNYVTVNDCANILLACGGSPIMADAAEEAEEITAICDGLLLNIGTLNERTVQSMLLAGRKAKELGHPVILDPVGAGASRLRTDTARKLLAEIKPEAVRCNISELKMLMCTGSVSRGVDAAEIDRIRKENLPEAMEMLRRFSAEYRCVTAVSGEIDVIADPGGKVCAVTGGHPMMVDITGSGCMLTALTAAYMASAPDRIFEAVSAAACVMKAAGTLAAAESLKNGEGNASFRTRLIDAVYHSGKDNMKGLIRYEMY